MANDKMKSSLLATLYRLAELGALNSEVGATTHLIAKKLSYSQQTASRHLIELERRGLIRRVKGVRGERLQLTASGVRELSQMYSVLKRAIEPPPKEVRLEGVVFTGLGEGAYYISQPGYRQQFLAKLGFDAFPGTLNLRLVKESLDGRKTLEVSPYINIEGFRDGLRTFGPVKSFRATVNEKVEAAVLLIVRTHYGEDVVELISLENLREKLRLKDGDVVRVKVLTESSQRSSL